MGYADRTLLDMIDKNTSEIKQDEDKTTYKTLDDIAEDLPDHAPRFILLSYPLTLVSYHPATSRLHPSDYSVAS